MKSNPTQNNHESAAEKIKQNTEPKILLGRPSVPELNIAEISLSKSVKSNFAIKNTIIKVNTTDIRWTMGEARESTISDIVFSGERVAISTFSIDAANFSNVGSSSDALSGVI